MSVSAALAMTLSVTETLTGVIPNSTTTAKDLQIVVNSLNVSKSLSGTSTPPITQLWTFEKALSGGAGQLDLRAMTGVTGAAGAQDGNGLKVQAVLFHNPSSNGNAITITSGSSNGYDLLGSFSLTLSPGDSLMVYKPDTAPDVATADKLLDLAGSGSQVLKGVVVLG